MEAREAGLEPEPELESESESESEAEAEPVVVPVRTGRRRGRGWEALKISGRRQAIQWLKHFEWKALDLGRDRAWTRNVPAQGNLRRFDDRLRKVINYRKAWAISIRSCPRNRALQGSHIAMLKKFSTDYLVHIANKEMTAQAREILGRENLCGDDLKELPPCWRNLELVVRIIYLDYVEGPEGGKAYTGSATGRWAGFSRWKEYDDSKRLQRTTGEGRRMHGEYAYRSDTVANIRILIKLDKSKYHKRMVLVWEALFTDFLKTFNLSSPRRHKWRSDECVSEARAAYAASGFTVPWDGLNEAHPFKQGCGAKAQCHFFDSHCTTKHRTKKQRNIQWIPMGLDDPMIYMCINCANSFTGRQRQNGIKDTYTMEDLAAFDVLRTAHAARKVEADSYTHCPCGRPKEESTPRGLRNHFPEHASRKTGWCMQCTVNRPRRNLSAEESDEYTQRRQRSYALELGGMSGAERSAKVQRDRFAKDRQDVAATGLCICGGTAQKPASRHPSTPPPGLCDNCSTIWGNLLSRTNAAKIEEIGDEAQVGSLAEGVKGKAKDFLLTNAEVLAAFKKLSLRVGPLEPCVCSLPGVEVPSLKKVMDFPGGRAMCTHCANAWKLKKKKPSPMGLATEVFYTNFVAARKKTHQDYDGVRPWIQKKVKPVKKNG